MATLVQLPRRLVPTPPASNSCASSPACAVLALNPEREHPGGYTPLHPVVLHMVGIASDRLAHMILPDAGVRLMSSSSGRTTGFEFLDILEWALQLCAH